MRTDARQVKCPLFIANMTSRAKVVVNQGGTSSGKTWNILDVFFTLAMMRPNLILTVAGQDIPNLKKGAYRDAKRIWSDNDIYRMYFDKPNETERIFTCRNGSIIEFNSYSDEQDARSGKRDYLFVNEANGISYEIYWQLAIRTKYKIFIDYNPTARFWVHDNLLGRDDVELLISDHRDNTFLTQEQHDSIEAIDDEELFKVYARGKTGKLEGLIFTNWDIVDSMPKAEETKLSVFGVDFGFSTDPSAIEHVVLAHGDLWIDEQLYSTGYTNPMLAEVMRERGVGRSVVIADCAEPKSIAELRASGINAYPSVKGKDSINIGIDILKRYRMHVTRRSVGLIEELKAYEWKKSRDGYRTNEPIGRYNHAIDAVRYVALAKLGVQRRGTAKATILRQYQ